MDKSRRMFIGSMAALAALAVVPSTGAPLPPTERARLLNQMKVNGVIEGQAFFLEGRGPIVIGVDNLKIKGCYFEWKNGVEDCCVLIPRNVKGTRLENCQFVSSEGSIPVGIRCQGPHDFPSGLRVQGQTDSHQDCFMVRSA